MSPLKIETLERATKELSDATGLADGEEEQFSPPLRVSRRVAEVGCSIPSPNVVLNSGLDTPDVYPR
jgi:hypothetical protein